jgi:hypothetical protein
MSTIDAITSISLWDLIISEDVYKVMFFTKVLEEMMSLWFIYNDPDSKGIIYIDFNENDKRKKIIIICIINIIYIQKI